MIVGTENRFLPADQLEELVTKDAVSSAFKETGLEEGAELERLMNDVLTKRQRLFLILVRMTQNNKEKLSSLRNKEWDGISDDSLPLVASDCHSADCW